MMTTAYTSAVKLDDNWWIGWIEAVPATNCREPSREPLLESLRTVLHEALDFSREEAHEAAGNGYQQESIVL